MSFYYFMSKPLFQWIWLFQLSFGSLFAIAALLVDPSASRGFYTDFCQILRRRSPQIKFLPFHPISVWNELITSRWTPCKSDNDLNTLIQLFPGLIWKLPDAGHKLPCISTQSWSNPLWPIVEEDTLDKTLGDIASCIRLFHMMEGSFHGLC